MKQSSIFKYLGLGVLVILLMCMPLVFKSSAAFEGTDGEALALIEEINPEYKPWAKGIFEPPSGEVETLLFCIQTAIGTAVIFYYLGYAKGKKKYADHR